MFKIPKKVLFAIEAVLDIAYHAGAQPVQSREITRRQGIPRRYLEQALQNLVRNGLLHGVRGPRGGYRLARERRRITISDIIQAVSNDSSESNKVFEEAGSDLGQKIIQPLWIDLEKDLMSRLSKMTLDDMCGKANALNIESEGRQNLDFTI